MNSKILELINQLQLEIKKDVEDRLNRCLNQLKSSNAFSVDAKNELCSVFDKEFKDFCSIQTQEVKPLSVNEIQQKLKLDGVIESTATTYLNSFKRIIKNCFEDQIPDVSGLSDVSKIMDYLNSLNLSVAKTVLNGYMNCIKRMNINISNFETEFKLIAKKADDARAYAAPTEKQEENHLTMEEIEQKRNELKENAKKFREYVLLCLYTYIPPLRAQDYRNSFLYEDSSKEETIDTNYLCLKTKRLVLCNYKTAKSHGTRIIDIPDVLIPILTQYKTQYKAKYVVSGKNGEQISQTAFVKFMQRIFGDKKVSTNLLRKFFVSEKIVNENMSGIDRKKVANVMGHTLATAQLNYSTFSNICKNDS